MISIKHYQFKLFKPSSDNEVDEWFEQIIDRSDPLESFDQARSSKKDANIVLNIQKYFRTLMSKPFQAFDLTGFVCDWVLELKMT